MMDVHDLSDEDLLAHTSTSGSAAAFGELYRRYEEPLLLFLLRRVGGVDVAADLVSEVFAAALEGAAGFRGASAAAWLFGIARNVLYDSYRDARVQNSVRERLGVPPLAITDELVEHLEHLADVSAGADALARLDRLPDDQRDAIRAHVLDDRNYAELAQELECSTGVVRQRVSRGLAALRNQLQEPV
jgi:RNA polymerase sigma factor (sigma-70 family)